MSKAGPEEAVIYADIGERHHFTKDSGRCALTLSQLVVDLQYLADVRKQIPITTQRRHDLYAVMQTQGGSSG